MKVVTSALLVTLVASACPQVKHPLTTAASPEAGALSIYLLPLPREAARLSFHVAEISAVRDDGAVLPLTLILADVGGGAPARERRLAQQDLPPGRYTGLAVGVTAASLEGDKGAAALLPPPNPVTIQIPFAIEKRRAVVLSLGFNYRDSIESGFRFNPVFSASLPLRPAPGLIGLASSRGSDRVTLFDKVSGRIAGIIPTGRRPAGMEIDPDRQRAYIAASGEDAVEALGLLEQAVLGRVRLRGGDEPVELAITPDGRTLLAANAGSGTVSVIDAVPLVERARIPVGNGPRSVLVDRAGRRAYVFNSGSSTVTVVDIAARAAAGTIATDAGPLRGEFNRSGDKLYVIHRSSPYLTVIDPLALAVSNRVYVGPGATALKVDPRTDRIYLCRGGARLVEIFDPLSLLPVDSIPTEGDVSFLAIDGEGNNLYLVLPEKREVQVLRIVGKETTARVEVGDSPYAVALLGER